ncbi:MAG: hypothetical protein KF867_03400 [Cryobacterium sp.]|nr:hypothetical protein [Cryobacterium sp.]
MDAEWSFDTFNAKKMSAKEIATSFVTPPAFAALAGADHCYLIGPRGSGKTTLLRMLHGESLEAWRGRAAAELRAKITYSSIFLPADELWASQTNESNSRAAFATQMLYAFVESMMYRTGNYGRVVDDVHLGVALDHDQEVAIAQQCAKAWGLVDANPSFLGLQEALDFSLVQLSGGSINAHFASSVQDPLRLLTFGVRAFNRVAGQPHHRWALLLDEMELAPPEIHTAVVSFVRGGSADLILKVSMSPFDRYMDFYGNGGAPMPGHDFQTIYLSGQGRREIRSFTNGLWEATLRARALTFVPMSRALGTSSITREQTGQRTSGDEVNRLLRTMQSADVDFAHWLRAKRINLNQLGSLNYNERSATIRKIYPLLVFRDALLTFRDGRPVRRSRKKSLEPFTGASAVTTLLEGNPRWIKTAFAQMLNYYDERTGTISAGFQYDALVSLANRFESLLRVLPRRVTSAPSVPVPDLVDAIAVYLNQQNTTRFSADPQNCFTVDRNIGPDIVEALVLGLYAGAFVHVRDRRSPAVLKSFEGQRFRLAYLLAVRDEKEFPLRLGKDVRLSTILAGMKRGAERSPHSRQLQLDMESM